MSTSTTSTSLTTPTDLETDEMPDEMMDLLLELGAILYHQLMDEPGLELHELAFDLYSAGLKLGLEIGLAKGHADGHACERRQAEPEAFPGYI